ncbi:MarR family transcriptional regulator [bacterium]|nr:MarR family transcriptional regulator [bacterium]
MFKDQRGNSSWSIPVVLLNSFLQKSMAKKKTNSKKRASNSREVMQKKDYEALAAFRYALRKFFRFSEEEASKFGLSMRQYQAMLTICGFPDREEITMGEMAEWLQIKHHSAVGLVDRLESQNLVNRKKDKNDKRVVCIRLTRKGKQILEKLASLNKQELKRLKPQIRQLSDLL